MRIQTHFENQKEVIIQELNNARQNIKIAVAWFTNQDIYSTLCEKINSGIEVELIIINDEINNRVGGLNWQEFIDIGGELYFGLDEYPMHHKFCVIDESVLINGSFNWTYLASTINCENIVVFKGAPKIIDSFLDEFDRLINTLEIQTNIIPFPEVPIQFTSVFGIKNYLSNDIQQRALIEKKKGKMQNARNLIDLAANINPGNEKAKAQRLEINNVIYRQWQEDYIIDKIELLENRTILHFRTTVDEGAWAHGPNAKFAWFLRNTNNRDDKIRMIKVRNFRLNNENILEVLTGNSILQFDTDDEKKEEDENYDWMENRGYKPSRIKGQFVDHHNRTVNVIKSIVKSGDVLECEIVFPLIPKGIKTLDLIEGEGRDDWENHWNCFDISIDKNLIRK